MEANPTRAKGKRLMKTSNLARLAVIAAGLAVTATGAAQASAHLDHSAAPTAVDAAASTGDLALGAIGHVSPDAAAGTNLLMQTAAKPLELHPRRTKKILRPTYVPPSGGGTAPCPDPKKHAPGC